MPEISSPTPGRSRTMLCLVAAVLVLGASACADDAEGTELAPASTASESSSTSTGSSPATTSAPSDSGSESGPDTESGSESGSSAESTASSRTGTAVGRPDQVTPGTSPVWAVYVAVATVGDSESLQPAVDRVETAGYAPTTGSLCEVAAYQPLGLDTSEQYDTVAVFFASEADASAFVELMGDPVKGVVQVLVSACADGS